MDKRLSVLIKEIQKSRTSTSIINLIKFDKSDTKHKDADKKSTKKKGGAKIVSIDSVKKDVPKTTTKVVEEKVIKPIDTLKPEVVVNDEVYENDIDETLTEQTIEKVKVEEVESNDCVKKMFEATNAMPILKPVKVTPNVTKLTASQDDAKVDSSITSKEEVIESKVSEELKRVAMTGMKLTKSSKARQKEYSKAKKAEDRKRKAREKEAQKESKVESKVNEPRVIDPNTPFGALTLSMDRLDEEMKLVMDKIGQDISSIKQDFPIEDSEEQEYVEQDETIESEENLNNVNTVVENKTPLVKSIDTKALLDVTNITKDTKTTDAKISNEADDIAQFVRNKGERKMDRAYNISKVNRYAKILDEVSSIANTEKDTMSTEAKAKVLLRDAKAVTNTAIELKPMRLLYVCSECQPFIATGGLADVAGSLPEAIRAANPHADMRVIMPLYADIKQEYKEKFEFVTSFTVHLSWRQQYCGIFKFVKNNVTYYFLDNEYYFNRKGTYGYYDDGERFAFFSKAVVEALPVLDYFPNVMHCNDWQSALCSTYVKTCYENDYRYSSIKHVFTIHNIQYQGRFSKILLGDLFGIDPKYMCDLEYDNDINLVKSAINYADYFTTVSPSYCDDLKQVEHSYGLHYEVNRQAHKLVGILNGIDYSFYHPSNDPCIYKHYDVDSIDKKVENKIAIQKEYGLPISTNTPLIVMATRLVSHKGLDLISRIMDEVLKDDIQFMIVGTGDDKYIEYFKSLESRYPTKVKALVGQYSNPIARKLYAAGDIYIMPSKNEPCGLSQMISSIYGCVPIVRETGGLKDSIKDFGCAEGGNGYTFAHYNAHDLLYSIRRAVSDFRDRKEWKNKMKTVMKVDFSWSKPAKDYLTLYNELV